MQKIAVMSSAEKDFSPSLWMAEEDERALFCTTELIPFREIVYTDNM